MLPPLFLVQNAINFYDRIKMYFSTRVSNALYLFSPSHSMCSLSLSVWTCKEEERGQYLLPAINFSLCKFPPHSDRKTAQVMWCYLCSSQHVFCVPESVATQQNLFAFRLHCQMLQRKCATLCLDSTVKEMGKEGGRDWSTGQKNETERSLDECT